jgi:chondroitin AC lyase
MRVKYDKPIVEIFILSVLSFLSVSTYSLNDDISIIRQRVLEQMIWPTPNSIVSIVQRALRYSGTLNSSCYWPDVNYTDQGRAIWLTAEHMSRITTMLQALTVNGSTVQNDTKILSAAHCALNVWLIRDWQNPNWWWNRISIPISATGHLLMLGNNVTSFELEKIKEISYRANWWNGDIWTTGCNLVWMIQSQLYRSLATENVTGIEQGFTRMWQDIVIQPLDKEGVQNDFAYHFHGTQLLSAAYGQDWALNIFSFFLCSVGTQFAPDSDKLILFAEFLTKGDAWMIISNQWDWHVRGRAIARADQGYLVNYNTDKIRALAQVIPLVDLRYNLNNFADRLDNRLNAIPLIGNKQFYTSDYHVHRRANWTSAIKMQSIRTNPDECGNGENLKREHTGQGVLNLFTTNTYDYVYLFPLLDWQAINGITVEHDIPLIFCDSVPSSLIRLPFVGGVSDGLYGLAMMDTATHNLTAKRSWHFYDDAIIALATNLTLTTRSTAWTTLASRLLRTGQVTVGFFNSTIVILSDGNYSFPYAVNKTSNIQWIHVGETDIGYVLQGQGLYSAIGINVGLKTGNFDTIGAFNYTVTARTLTIWLDHGQGPYTLDYQYMILPNISLESMPRIIKHYDEEQVFSCISTNNLFHGTVWPSLKRASFVLWDNITTRFSCKSPQFKINIELSHAGAYLFSETDTDFTITASHPLQVNGSVQVTIDRVGYGEGCIVSSDNNISTTNVVLMLPSSTQLLGASVDTKCKKQGINDLHYK